MGSTKKKSQQLGVSMGTAVTRLRKLLLFRYLQDLDLAYCYRCHKPITDVGDLTMDHIKTWLDSDDPIGRYFDLNNVAFSHHSCNAGQARQTRVKMPDSERKKKKKEYDAEYRRTSKHYQKRNREYQREWKREKRTDPLFKEKERAQQREQRKKRSRSVVA